MQQPTAITYQLPYVPNETQKNQRQEKVSYLEMSESELERTMNFYLPEKNEGIRNRQKEKRFTKEQVFYILKSNQTHTVLAALYGVATSAISGVKTGKSYREWHEEFREGIRASHVPC